MQRKDFPGAVRDLSKITFGPAKEQAQALILQARIEGGTLPPEQVSQLALAAAGTAYAGGDFDKAEEMLKRVQSPSTKEAANQLEAKINLYRTTIKQGDAFAQSGDFKDAAKKYQAAATILPTVPASRSSTREMPLTLRRRLTRKRRDGRLYSSRPFNRPMLPQRKNLLRPKGTRRRSKVSSGLLIARRLPGI